MKNITYINKDFNSLKSALTDYIKTYYPNTYNDFSPSSPGMMFVELAAYVGDMLSFYQDNQIQENFIQYAKEKENLLTLAYMLGYSPKVTNASSVILDVYQQLPAITSGSVINPDFNYCMVLDEGTQIKSNVDPNLYFYVPEKIDFSFSSSFNPTEVTVYSTSANKPQYYLLKKQVQAISGQVKSLNFSIGEPQKFTTLTLEDTNVIEIINIVDSDGNKWYEVPYLAQETIFDDMQNSSVNSPNTSQYNDVPYILKLKKVSRRFVTRFKSNNSLEIQFGAGITNTNDENIIPNMENIGIGLPNGINKMNVAYDPSNFLYSQTYGIAPSNTTLTVNYLVGGGINSNAASNVLNNVINASVSFNNTNLDNTLSDYVVNSLAVNNPEAATGGKDGDTIDEIRLNTLANFSAQQRTVSKEDYVVRILSLPSKYGSVAKVYIEHNKQDKSVLDLYVLGYNNQSQLINASQALKQNIKTYLSQYNMLTDSINIKDAFIINIGVKFDIFVSPTFNSKEVLLRCNEAVKSYFDINNRQINQPIMVSDLYPILLSVKGVQNVTNIKIENKAGENLGYSKYGYDIEAATKNNIIYPSLDPSIFEVKIPNVDILGKINNI